MSGAELRRFVGGPFPNLAPATSAGRRNQGMVGGPYANLASRAGSATSATSEIAERRDGLFVAVPA